MRKWLSRAAGIVMIGVFIGLGHKWQIRGVHLGIHDEIESLAAAIPQDAHVYLHLKGPAHLLFLPMSLGHGCRVIPLPEATPFHQVSLRLLLEDAHERFDQRIPLYLIASKIPSGKDPSGTIRFQTIQNYEIQDLHLTHRPDRKPGESLQRTLKIELYRLSLNTELLDPTTTVEPQPVEPPSPKRHEMQLPGG